MLQHHERADTCDEADADGYRIVVYSTVVRIVEVSACQFPDQGSQTRLDLKT